MEKKLDCEIVRDLLPNYMERMTSEVTDGSIREHLDTCVECSEIYSQMNRELVTEHAPEPEEVTRELKKYMNKTKVMYGMNGLLGLCIIGIMASVIVDIILSRALTWSLIVTGGVVFGYSIVHVFVYSVKNKIRNTMLCITVFVLPFLFLVEIVVNKYFLTTPVKWFWSMGVPISVIWLFFLWFTLLFNKVIKINWSFRLSILLVLAIPATEVTNYIGNSYTMQDGFRILVNTLGTVLMAIVFFFIGISIRRNKNK